MLEKERPSIKSPGRLLFFILASEASLGTTFIFEATTVDIIPISAPMNSLPFLSSLLLVSVSAGELLKQHFKTSISC